MFKKIILSSILASLLVMNVSLAQTPNPTPTTTTGNTGLIPKASGETSEICRKKAPAGVDPATYCGDYTVDDFIKLGIIASDWILGIIGSLTLAMFVYGGFLFLISSGDTPKITQAKQIIVASVVGLIIVFSSYLIVKFVIDSLNVTNSEYRMNPNQTSIDRK